MQTAQVIPFNKHMPRVLSPRFIQSLGDVNFAARVYRGLEARIINVDVTPALHGEKPRLVIDAPAFIDPPTFGRVEVTRLLPSNLH